MREDNYMRNQTTIKLLGGAAALAVLATGFSAQAATTLKVSSCLQKNHDQIQAFADTFLKPINAMKTDLKLRYIGGPEVTPRKKQAPAMKRGLIDIIVCPTPYYGGLLSEARLPGVHSKSLTEMRSNGAWKMMQEAWGKGLNAHILGWGGFEASTFYVYTKFKPKLSEKTGLDLSGQKMRSTGLYNAFLKAMNATPVNISPGDVYSALERGLVTGLAWPRGSMAKYGWQRFLKYRIEPNFYGATLMATMNLDKYKSLTSAQRALLDKQGLVYEANSDKILDAKAKIDNAKLKKSGIEIITLTGKVGKAYIDTIYNSKWAQNDKLKYIVDYKKLKSLMLN
jgi:TRAP-type transport system periplasmic protein